MIRHRVSHGGRHPADPIRAHQRDLSGRTAVAVSEKGVLLPGDSGCGAGRHGNRIEQDILPFSEGAPEMGKYKFNQAIMINGETRWITANSTQELIDKAMTLILAGAHPRIAASICLLTVFGIGLKLIQSQMLRLPRPPPTSGKSAYI